MIANIEGMRGSFWVAELEFSVMYLNDIVVLQHNPRMVRHRMVIRPVDISLKVFDMVPKIDLIKRISNNIFQMRGSNISHFLPVKTSRKEADVIKD